MARVSDVPMDIWVGEKKAVDGLSGTRPRLTTGGAGADVDLSQSASPAPGELATR